MNSMSRCQIWPYHTVQRSSDDLLVPPLPCAPVHAHVPWLQDAVLARVLPLVLGRAQLPVPAWEQQDIWLKKLHYVPRVSMKGPDITAPFQ